MIITLTMLIFEMVFEVLHIPTEHWLATSHGELYSLCSHTTEVE